MQMKTLKELFAEIEGSEALKNELKAIKDEGALEEFLKKNGCEAAAEELAAYVNAQSEGELGDDVAASAVGGTGDTGGTGEIWWNPFAMYKS